MAAIGYDCDHHGRTLFDIGPGVCNHCSTCGSNEKALPAQLELDRRSTVCRSYDHTIDHLLCAAQEAVGSWRKHQYVGCFACLFDNFASEAIPGAWGVGECGKQHSMRFVTHIVSRIAQGVLCLHHPYAIDTRE